MNDSHPIAGAPSLDDLSRALDTYVDDEDIFHIGLMVPSAAPRTPGDRLDVAWTAFRRAAMRFKREILRARNPDTDLYEWEMRVEAVTIPEEVETDYLVAYLDACPTSIDRHIAFAEYKVNTRLVHTWRMYVRCCISPLIDTGVEILKTHVGYLRHEEQQHRILEFQRRVALRKIARFVVTHPRMCDDCRRKKATTEFLHLDGRSFRLCLGCFSHADHVDGYLAHVEPPRLRMRKGPCTVCGDSATHIFRYRWGADTMCRACYEAACQEAEDAAIHNAYRSCPHLPSECEGDCGILRCGCWEGECECFTHWGRA